MTGFFIKLFQAALARQEDGEQLSLREIFHLSLAAIEEQVERKGDDGGNRIYNPVELIDAAHQELGSYLSY